MIRNYICIVIITICLAGCSGYRQSWVMKDAYKNKFESACVVFDENASPKLKEHITNVLLQRGVKISPATSKKDCSADFVVLYYDRYDFVLFPLFPLPIPIPIEYLTSLGIRFYDPKSDSFFATSDYWIDTCFSGSQQQVPDELLNLIFDEIKIQAGSSTSEKIHVQADSSTKSLTQKLQELQTALDNRLITKEEYQLKRKEIIEKH